MSQIHQDLRSAEQTRRRSPKRRPVLLDRGADRRRRRRRRRGDRHRRFRSGPEGDRGHRPAVTLAVRQAGPARGGHHRGARPGGSGRLLVRQDGVREQQEQRPVQ